MEGKGYESLPSTFIPNRRLVMEKSFFRLLRQIVLLGLRTSVLACVIFSTLEPSPAQIPKRINKAIELLSQGQPNYHTMANDKSYEGGKKMAQTWADYITYDMEHNPLDIPRLARFMQGLVDGGRRKAGIAPRPWSSHFRSTNEAAANRGRKFTRRKMPW